ncbi:Hypothetical predicted protein [Olea europaea subsp. europaea]|uniref:Uncharacterized protein n=1 Tax=Olea europaea subsp. europaea TaxID=158383 RepID=A0A8S0SEK0_OLEEU|nr:Hypothetical predicted protein [Olea europaea subsp. europaea]
MAKLNNISGYSHRAVAVESFQNLIVSCLSPEPICQQKNHSNFSLPLQILYDVCCSTPFVLILQRAKPGAPVSSCSRRRCHFHPNRPINNDIGQVTDFPWQPET